MRAVEDSRIAIGYIRVSTDAQGERGYGLDAQADLIREEMTRREWTQGRIYVDVASGKSTKRRPQYAQAVRELSEGRAHVLVVAKLDRLSRSLLDFAALMAQSSREGWSIDALDIGVDTSTINGELIANIIMALAQWERRIIGQRTKLALGQVKHRGEVKLGRPTTVTRDAVAIITAMVKAYTRGRGFVGTIPAPDVEAVIVTASARFTANPEQVERYQAADYAETPTRFLGFTLPELAVLNRYRKRAAG